MKYVWYAGLALMIAGTIALPFVIWLNHDLAPVGMMVTAAGLLLSRISGDPAGWKR